MKKTRQHTQRGTQNDNGKLAKAQPLRHQSYTRSDTSLQPPRARGGTARASTRHRHEQQPLGQTYTTDRRKTIVGRAPGKSSFYIHLYTLGVLGQ